MALALLRYSSPWIPPISGADRVVLVDLIPIHHPVTNSSVVTATAQDDIHELKKVLNTVDIS